MGLGIEADSPDSKLCILCLRSHIYPFSMTKLKLNQDKGYLDFIWSDKLWHLIKVTGRISILTCLE